MKVKDLIKWLREKNPEADIYVGEDGSTICHDFRGLESFLDHDKKERTTIINYDKKKKLNKNDFYAE